MATRMRYKDIWPRPLTSKELDAIAKAVLEAELAQWNQYENDVLYPDPFDRKESMKNREFSQ